MILLFKQCVGWFEQIPGRGHGVIAPSGERVSLPMLLSTNCHQLKCVGTCTDISWNQAYIF